MGEGTEGTEAKGGGAPCVVAGEGRARGGRPVSKRSSPAAALYEQEPLKDSRPSRRQAEDQRETQGRRGGAHTKTQEDEREQSQKAGQPFQDLC